MFPVTMATSRQVNSLGYPSYDIILETLYHLFHTLQHHPQWTSTLFHLGSRNLLARTSDDRKALLRAIFHWSLLSVNIYVRLSTLRQRQISVWFSFLRTYWLSVHYFCGSLAFPNGFQPHDIPVNHSLSNSQSVVFCWFLNSSKDY